ncbi:hypothetical protein E2C01_040649 [Portunus trituberculatus]|uniref:Uncharacterized protein n=1 Tax=Portunus trituberculatus TaxID=210409 RepID=A0A5B7FPS6_PORTR|nr:hypothetical protein [Portunus trituberculatus]
MAPRRRSGDGAVVTSLPHATGTAKTHTHAPESTPLRVDDVSQCCAGYVILQAVFRRSSVRQLVCLCIREPRDAHLQTLCH